MLTQATKNVKNHEEFLYCEWKQKSVKWVLKQTFMNMENEEKMKKGYNLIIICWVRLCINIFCESLELCYNSEPKRKMLFCHGMPFSLLTFWSSIGIVVLSMFCQYAKYVMWHVTNCTFYIFCIKRFIFDDVLNYSNSISGYPFHLLFKL